MGRDMEGVEITNIIVDTGIANDSNKELKRPDVVYVLNPIAFYEWKRFMYESLLEYCDVCCGNKSNTDINGNQVRIFSFLTRKIKYKIKDMSYFNDVEYIEKYLNITNSTITLDDIKEKYPEIDLAESDDYTRVIDDGGVHYFSVDLIDNLDDVETNNSFGIYYGKYRYFVIKCHDMWIDVKFSNPLIADLFVFERLIHRNMDKSFKMMRNLLDRMFLNTKLEYDASTVYDLTAQDLVDLETKRYKYLGCKIKEGDSIE